MTASCDTCRAPGSCCSAFTLNMPVKWNRQWKSSATKKLAKHGLSMFVPVRQRIGADGHELNAILYSCTWLGADGRCTDYKNRPGLCRRYQPGDDMICAEFEHRFKGIPIRVAA